tara:strand:+ start:278 stop:406 length:129 start_codon:yes stop_codon:yes gene_type:complete
MKEIKLNEKPFKKHCITQYINIDKTIPSNKFRISKKLSNIIS